MLGLKSDGRHFPWLSRRGSASSFFHCVVLAESLIFPELENYILPRDTRFSLVRDEMSTLFLQFFKKILGAGLRVPALGDDQGDPPSRKATAGQVTRERARATRGTTAVEAAVTAAIRRNSQATPLPLMTSQATRLPLQSHPINNHDFSLVWPVFCSLHKTGANGIVANIIPFLGITLRAAQNAVEESRLPESLRF